MKANQVIYHLEQLKLEDALWWFIENATDEATWKSEVFFYLRERYFEEA